MNRNRYLIGALLVCNLTLAQIDRRVQPQASPEPEINFGTPQEYQFSNGLTLMVVENHKLPQVSVSLRIDSPLYTEGERAGINGLLTRMMGKGSTNVSKDAFEEEIDFMGAHFHFNSDGAHASSLTRYFPRVFELLADATLHPNFIESELTKEKDKLIEALKTSEKDVKTVARRVENLLSYGPAHPRGEYITESSIGNTDMAALKAQYQKMFHAQNAYLIVVGDIDFATAKKMTKKHFGRWKKGTVANSQFPAPTNVAQTEIAFVEMPNAVQSEISAIFTFDLDKKNPDYYAAMIANQILGGGGEARLFLNLREDKGYTYGAYASLSDSRKTKARLRTFASVRNAVTDSAIVQMIYEIGRLGKEFVTEKELETVKQKYSGSLIGSLEDPENIANFAYSTKTQQLPEDFYNNLLKNIKKVTREDIQRVGNKYFSDKQLRIVVTGKGSDILSNLENVKMGNQVLSVKYYDKYGTATVRPSFSKPIPAGITAQTIIENYLDAIGGSAALEKIKSRHMVYEANLQGMTIQMEEKKADNTKMSMEIKMMGNTVQRIVINSEAAFMEAQGQKIPIPKAQKEASQASLPIFPELFFGEKVTLKGIVDKDGKEAYEIKINEEKTYYFDTTTHLKIAEINVQDGSAVETKITAYKEVSGLKIPETVVSQMGPQEVNFVLKSVRFNSVFSEAEFQ